MENQKKIQIIIFEINIEAKQKNISCILIKYFEFICVVTTGEFLFSMKFDVRITRNLPMHTDTCEL